MENNLYCHLESFEKNDMKIGSSKQNDMKIGSNKQIHHNKKTIQTTDRGVPRT